MVERAAVKECPGCGRPIYDYGHAFCTMRCSDDHKRKKRSVIESEVAMLMRQYHEGNWLPVP